MIKKITVFCLLLALSIPAISQETTTKKRTGRPDLPGTFVLELGLNHPRKAIDDFNTGFWGSRSLNIYYTYDIRILKSDFSFVPGIGVSLERWKFVNGYVLGNFSDSLKMNDPDDLGIPGVKKSQLVTNYIEVPLEFCYRVNPEDPARSFKIALGARFGYLFDSFAKVKYKEEGEVKKFKDKQDFELSKFRYALTARIGLGNVSVFGYYNMTPMFEKGKGPVDPEIGQKDFNTFTIGLSLASF
jgi:hypothetical protein